MTKEPGAWLTPEMRSAIKDIMEHTHGVAPSDEDINWVSAGEESRARIQYQSRIIRRLETLLVRRSQTTAHPHRASDLLTEANGCYRDGRFDACIIMSRAAVEAALQSAVGKRGNLKDLIALASKNQLFDGETLEMAHTLRELGNEFAHYDYQRILAREEARIDEVVFVGEQPMDTDRPSLEALIRVNSAASSLAFRAYQSAVRICEKLIPPST